MPKRLSKAEIGCYRDQGYCSPITILAPDDAAAFLNRLDLAAAGHAEAASVLKMKSHLVFACLDELVHLPAILDAVEDLLGPDILAWSSSIFAKGPVYMGQCLKMFHGFFFGEIKAFVRKWTRFSAMNERFFHFGLFFCWKRYT